MGRKIEVGATYRLPDVTVVRIAPDGRVIVVIGGVERGLWPEQLADATLVKAAERPLKVGEVAWWGNETWTILAIDEGYVWLKACGSNYRRIALFADLRRVEPT